MAAITSVVVLFGGATAVAMRGHTRVAASPGWDVAGERSRRDADIAWYTMRAERDPTGAFDRLRLAALYLQRARERGSPADLLLAEQEARRSLANRRAHNSEAFRVLAIALIGQHRFAEAADATDSLLTADPASHGAQSLRAEIALEQGDYHLADRLFMPLDHPGRTLPSPLESPGGPRCVAARGMPRRCSSRPGKTLGAWPSRPRNRSRGMTSVWEISRARLARRDSRRAP
ncbi:MAG: hypothetical protein IPJ11_15020 [Gemmatimonadetes bacterium]|nr:hypothetical protein [Gemmatimonadota bacterium]